jgi:hypothetical protein
MTATARNPTPADAPYTEHDQAAASADPLSPEILQLQAERVEIARQLTEAGGSDYLRCW